MSEERDLVDRASRGDVDAFTTLIERHDRPLRALAYRLLGDRDAMDDALQEAYVKAFRFLPSFSGESSVGSWLYRIVYNACVDELRRRPVRLVSIEGVREHADPKPGPSETAVRRRDLEVALASLPPDHRAVVLLVDAEGLDYASAAEVLGVPPGTIGSRLNRARAALRGALQDPSEGVEEA